MYRAFFIQRCKETIKTEIYWYVSCILSKSKNFFLRNKYCVIYFNIMLSRNFFENFNISWFINYYWFYFFQLLFSKVKKRKVKQHLPTPYWNLKIILNNSSSAKTKIHKKFNRNDFNRIENNEMTFFKKKISDMILIRFGSESDNKKKFGKFLIFFYFSWKCIGKTR